jgi:hypothetical protein
MKRDMKTKVREKVVMMAIRPLMLEGEIVPSGFDTPGMAVGVEEAIMG